MAQANADVLKDMIKSQELATKKDIEPALAHMRNELVNSISDCKHEILKWVIGMMIAETT